MTTVGPSVTEIRIKTQLEHRVFYIAKFDEAVYVLHAFEKRTRRTTNPDIDLAKKRLKDLMQLRAKKPEKR